MGEAELNIGNSTITIHSVFFFYGDAASQDLSVKMAEDISMHWNEPRATVIIDDHEYEVKFDISAYYESQLDPERVWYNDNPRFNFFRVEEFAEGDISYVDEIGSNTGYLKLANILQTSTTIAHEYGHTLGLIHPEVLDIRGYGIPGIMYPRGTMCDASLQYDPTAQPAAYGGFLNPAHRKVMQTDIDALNIPELDFRRGFAKLGEFTSIYHARHIAGA